MAVPLTLNVFKGSALVSSKEFDKDIIKIGRLSSAHLCLDDEKVSRIHSVIETSPDGSLSIIDMGSVEGTYVNGKRVNKGTLAFGDEIKVGNRTMHGRAYVAGFNFKGSDQQKKVGVLSGGERNRVHLAKVLKQGGNVLMLDEPTNDLDVDTLRALEEALLAFPGCVLVTSHDRFFLDRIATHILAFEGESQVRWFEGNFTDYEADRKKRLVADAETPHRIKYKPISR